MKLATVALAAAAVAAAVVNVEAASLKELVKGSLEEAAAAEVAVEAEGGEFLLLSSRVARPSCRSGTTTRRLHHPID